MKKNFTLSMNNEPIIIANAVLPTDSDDVRKHKNKLQFLNIRTSILSVCFPDETFTVTANSGYEFDGATIPFNIGKGNMKLLIPALFHDIMCDRKEVVNYNRNLSSKIFKELLLMCGNPTWKANLMYFVVDNYQKFMKGWQKQ